MILARIGALLLVASTALQTPPKTSAGALALLPAKPDDATRELIRRAIVDEQPTVRAVAARMVAAGRESVLAESLLAAWERETDSMVAAEQVRSLLIVRGAAIAATIEQRLDRVGKPASVALAEWTARMQPELLADRLPKLASHVGDDLDALTPPVLVALDKRPASSEQLLRNWLAVSTPKSWRHFMDRLPLAIQTDAHLAVLAAALDTENAGIREQTVWSLVARTAPPDTPAVLLDSALSTAAKHRLPDGVNWEMFGRELLERRFRSARTSDRADLLRAEALRHVYDARAIARFPDMTRAEVDALKSALGDAFPKPVPSGAPSLDRAERTAAMRTLPVLWPGVLVDLLKAADCRPNGPRPLAAVRIAHLPEGSSLQSSVQGLGLTGGCTRAVEALARLTLPDSFYPPIDAAEWLIVPLDSDFIACATDAAFLPYDTIPAVGQPFGPVKRPTKARDIHPVYPQPMQEQRIQGVVILEAVISSTGCITSAQVVKGVEPMLDLSALHAVSGWKYRPAEIDGRPVPAKMTVTVNFWLQ